MAATGDMVDQETRRVGGPRRVRLPPVGFWSYARQDDYLSQGKLTSLRSLLMFEVQQLYGRGEIRLFQDASTIPHGAAWENEVREALSQSTFFIAIITPNFIQSEWCCREISLFVEREAELHRLHPDLDRRSRILPIHYIDVTDVDPADPDVLTLLNSLQWFDFRRLRHRDFEGEQVRQAIAELAEGIKGLLNLRVEDPEALRARQRAMEEERKRMALAAAEQARQEDEARLKAEQDRADAVRAAEQRLIAERAAQERAAAEYEAEEIRKREAEIAEAEAARKKAEAAVEEARRRAEEAEEAARQQAALAAEAARMVAAEREAAEQARREAAAIAQRLNDAEAAAAAQAAAQRARESADRAQAEQEQAARNQQEAQILAERARLESDEAEARQQFLADQVAQQRFAADPGVAPQANRIGAWPWLVTGAVALAAILYLLWPRQDAANGVAPIVRNDQPVTETRVAEPTDPRAWLTRSWGMDGNCAYLVDISIEGDTLRVRFGGEVQTLRVQPPRAGESWEEVVRTDRATYTRRGNSVEVREAGAVSEIPYRLDRCAGR